MSLSEHLTPTQIEGYCRHKLSAIELLSVSNHLNVCEACSLQVEGVLGGDAAFFRLRSEVIAEMVSLPGERGHLTFEETAGYVDETIAGEELQIVKDHLTDCEQCEMAVSDLRAFREQIIPGLNREYRPSPVVAEPLGRRVVAYLSSLWPRSPLPVFASALAALLLILTGWLLWRALAGKEAEIVETPPSSPTPGVTPVVTPGPMRRDKPAIMLVRLNDGGGQVTLDQKGNLSGIDNLPPTYRQMIKGALTDQQLKRSQLLAEFIDPLASFSHPRKFQKGLQIRGRADQDREFSTINPVRTVILSDRPVFRWSRLDGASSYVVEVYDNKFTMVTASTQLIDNSWTVPESLPRGKIYIWQVKAIKDGQGVISPRPDEAMAKFRILDQARANELEQARSTYPRSHLVLGVLYARDGLLEEAELELRALQKANPGSAIVRRLLANVRAMRN
jgi:hypothetical protein